MTLFDREDFQLHLGYSRAILELTKNFKVENKACAVRIELGHLGPFFMVSFSLISPCSVSKTSKSFRAHN